uniref:Late embryogenesis abundant protein LEA-2 subgroup domain-containing protein n=1 Tax=Davidia involucrata TaxID=16924 RepID=A0A5B7C8S4_DAVIN
MDVESSPSKRRPLPHHTRKRRRNICFAVIAVILAVVLLIVILGLTVFKAKRAVTTVNSVALKDFQFSLDIARLRAYLNVTVDINLSVKKCNKVGFEFTNSSALLKYRGQVVGEAPILAGKKSVDETLSMNTDRCQGHCYRRHRSLDLAPVSYI